MTIRSLSFLIAVAGFVGFAQAGDSVDCSAVADATSKAVSADPDKVLHIVSKDVASNPSCVCPIIKAAIAASKADERTQEQIVKTAANAAPERTPEIKACLPEAAQWIDEATGKQPVGKQPVGKEVVEAPKEGSPDYSDDMFLLSPFGGGPGGTYLSSPSSGGGGSGTTGGGEPEIEIIVKKVPGKRPPSNPVTNS